VARLALKRKYGSRVATEATNSARSYARTASLLTVALGTAGALAYLFFAVASHNLSEEDYGQIVVLWSLVFLLVSILFRPVEQLLARTIADLEERGQSIRHASRVAAGIQLLVCGGFVALAVALRPVLQDDLFEGDAMLFWALVATVLAFAASYFARGFFAGSRQMGAYAALLLVEGSVRLGLALLVATGIATGMDPMVLAIAVAPLASLVVVPFALTRSRRRGPAEGEKHEPGLATEVASEFTLAQGGGFAAAVLLIMVSEQVLLNSGVLFVRGREDAAAAGFIFNVLMVARAPVVLFQAVAASLLPHLTRLRSRGDETSFEAFALSVRLTLIVIAGFGIAVALGLLAVGPSVMQIAFGDNFEYDRLGLVLVAMGMAFYLSAATLNQAVLAQAQAHRAASCWLASAAVFVLINLLPGLGAFRAVEIGFLVSSVMLCFSLYALYRHPRAEARDRLSPGSSAELEARLAAADDVI
jgi:O-antigen/teichoic acid export membrane protein